MSDSTPRWTGFESWRKVVRSFLRYWRAYGGWWAILTSPYVQIAVVLTIIVYFVRGTEDVPGIGIDVFSSLLGFTIGALAIVLAVSSTEVFVFLTEDGKPDYFFIKMVANIVHYTVIQVIGLIISISTLGLTGLITAASALFVFYTVLVSVSIGLQLFEMARVYNEHAGQDGDDEAEKDV